ncbi:MAG: AAA family ATPase [Caldilineaceae bacterium]|nr:AAA family ATPase [Caldilineaceae bacterium]
MSGSGKSTTCRGVAEHFTRAMHIDVDKLRDMMVTGRAKPSSRPDIVTEEWRTQLQLARSTATCMANLYASQGVDVVIDDFCWPPNFPEYYADLFDNPEVHRVLLLPSQSALVERVTKRGGPFADVFVKNTPYVYSYLEAMPKEGWIVLDSSDWTVEETVHEVLARVGVTHSHTKYVHP